MTPYIKITKHPKGISVIRGYSDGLKISIFVESEKQVIDAVYDFLRGERNYKEKES